MTISQKKIIKELKIEYQWERENNNNNINKKEKQRLGWHIFSELGKLKEKCSDLGHIIFVFGKEKSNLNLFHFKRYAKICL